MFDYHVHTSFSADSTEPIESYLKSLPELGIEELCITEHLAINFHRGNWLVDLEPYTHKLWQLQQKGYPIKIGVEADVSCQESEMPQLLNELQRVPLDFVLASSHSYRDKDPYMEDFFMDGDPIAVCREYLSNLLQNLKRVDPALFSCLAHVDYLAKGFGAKYLPGGVFRYEYAPDEMDALLRYAIENGKCIEINTSSPQSLIGTEPPVLSWLRRYRELGGEFVTVGSDSHKVDRLGERLSLAQELAAVAGIRYIATFTQMQPCMHVIQ